MIRILEFKRVNMKNRFTIKPILLKSTDRQLLKLKKEAFVVDEIAEQIKELELVKNPKLLNNPIKLKINKKIETCWAYYPWRNSLVHCLNQKDFKKLRTSRNQELITKEEQKKLEKIRVGIAGLNVGNPGAICLSLEGNIKMKLADNDVLSVSNLNRFRSGLPDLGINKAVLSAHQIYELNPYAEIEVFENGISEDNLERFFLDPRIDVLVEEMDNLALKIRIREAARAHRVPVVMVTGSGEDAIIDVERFDLNPRLPILSGYLKKEIISEIKSGQPMSFEKRIRIARDFMGAKYLHPRLVSSFNSVGKKLAGIPQIAESSFLRGAAISFFVRQIAQGAKIKSGRYYLKLSNVR